QGGFVATIKNAPHRTVHCVSLPPTPEHSQLTFFIKHYPLADLRSYIRQALRVPKARGEAEKALTLTSRGIRTVEPLAIGETARGESWLIPRGLENVQQLNQLIEVPSPQLATATRLRLRFALTRALARFMAKLHDAGVRHDDLHAGNILVRID